MRRCVIKCIAANRNEPRWTHFKTTNYKSLPPENRIESDRADYEPKQVIKHKPNRYEPERQWIESRQYWNINMNIEYKYWDEHNYKSKYKIQYGQGYEYRYECNTNNNIETDNTHTNLKTNTHINPNPYTNAAIKYKYENK